MKLDAIKNFSSSSIIFAGGLFIFAYILSVYIVSMKILQLIIILSLIIGSFLFINIKANYYFLLGYTVFIGLLKRLTFESGEIVKYNPIIIIPTIFSIFVAMNILLFYESRLLYYIRQNRLSIYITILFIILIIQIFNPIQGGMLVGLSGTIFILLPMLWFYFALILERDEIFNIMKFIIHLGFITGLFGIYQHYFGLFDFDEIWIKQSGLLFYLKGDVPRSFSTFTSSGDFAFFMEYSGTLAFFFFVYSKRFYFLMVTIVTLLGIYFSGTRSALLGMLYSIIVFFVMLGADRRRIIERFVLLTSILLVVYTILPERVQSIQKLHPGFRSFGEHIIVGVLNPTGEKSLEGRFTQWEYLLTSYLKKYPFGAGIGAGTIASTKFGGEFIYNDSAFFAIVIACGIVGLILISMIYYYIVKYSFFLCLNTKEYSFLHRLLFGYMMGQLLTGIFGVNFSFYTLAPFFWLFVGFLVKEYITATKVINVKN